MKKITTAILSIIGTLTGAVLLYIVWMGFLSPHSLYSELRAYDMYSKALQEDLQFTHGSPYYKIGDDTSEVFTLHPKSNSSPLAKAGVVSGDIVFDDITINRLYILLEEHRGRVFRFRVVQGGDGPALRERLQKIIELYVPEKKQKNKK